MIKAYLVSLALGALVGVIYGLFGVRSPAPPLIALAGLLGILIGEQSVPLVRHMLAGHSPAAAWSKTDRAATAFGRLPGDPGAKVAVAKAADPKTADPKTWGG